MSWLRKPEDPLATARRRDAQKALDPLAPIKEAVDRELSAERARERILERERIVERERLAAEKDAAGGDTSPTTEQPNATKPRHRPPDGIPKETVKQMMLELAKRKAKPPRHPEFTQEEIAARLALKVWRVQQAEALERVGWHLLRSHPEFSVNDEFVYWPNPKEAALILASERAEN